MAKEQSYLVVVGARSGLDFGQWIAWIRGRISREFIEPYEIRAVNEHSLPGNNLGGRGNDSVVCRLERFVALVQEVICVFSLDM